eukprot:4926961-Amphidinium_carterae.1
MHSLYFWQARFCAPSTSPAILSRATLSMLGDLHKRSACVYPEMLYDRMSDGCLSLQHVLHADDLTTRSVVADEIFFCCIYRRSIQ